VIPTVVRGGATLPDALATPPGARRLEPADHGAVVVATPRHQPLSPERARARSTCCPPRWSAARDGRSSTWATVASTTPVQPPPKILDAGGCTVIRVRGPHIPTCVRRLPEEEFDRRLAGVELHRYRRLGRGIVATVRRPGRRRLTSYSRSRCSVRPGSWPAGPPRIEAKSGYGLETGGRAQSSCGSREARRRHPVEIAPTAMPAHEVPPEWRGDPDGYVELVVSQIYPAIAQQGLAEGVDCSANAACSPRTRPPPARRRGPLRLVHPPPRRRALGPGRRPPGRGAWRLVRLAPAPRVRRGIAALAARVVVAVVLPGVSFFLRERYAPVRRLVEAGVPVALATDCNPGSSHTESMPPSSPSPAWAPASPPRRRSWPRR